MRLDLQTSGEVANYLETSTGIIMPIGSMEQHGPMGLIGTDTQTAQAVSRTAGEKADIMVGPSIHVGNAQHHLGFAGSMALRPSTLMLVIEDYVTSLARNGFTNFLFVNGHGGNISTVETAFQQIYSNSSFDGTSTGSNIRCRLVNWFNLPAVKSLYGELYGDAEGYHATPSEVALTQYIYPDAIKSMDPMPAAPLQRMFSDCHDFKSQYPDGRMASDSTLANPTDGKRFLEIAADGVIADYSAFMAGEK